MPLINASALVPVSQDKISVASVNNLSNASFSGVFLTEALNASGYVQAESSFAVIWLITASSNLGACCNSGIVFAIASASSFVVACGLLIIVVAISLASAVVSKDA